MDQMNLFDYMNTDRTDFNSICDSLGVENNTPAWPDRFGEAIKHWLVNNDSEPIQTLSLFSGAGGLDIGFSDVGFNIVSSVEIEKKFCETLELNTGAGKRFNHSKVNCIDIRDFKGDNLGKIDFIIGGPPCQTFSAAGRRANGVLGTTDARGILFKEYVRLLKELSPKGFLFENVYGIVGAQGGEPWKEILKAFSDVGYKLFYRILDAADYGVPQHRERLIIVGLKDGSFKFPKPTHGSDSIDDEQFYNAQTALDGVESLESDEENKLGGRYANLLDDIPPGLNYSFYTEEMGHPNPVFAWRSKFSDFLYKADPNTPVRTIKASGGAYTGPLHWENRFFKLEEYKRLQTFPDDYIISGKKQVAVKQIGNSVPPQLARIMAIAIRQEVFNTKLPFQLPLLENFEELSFRKRKRALTAVYKKKAALAIKSLDNKLSGLPDSCEYYCHLSSNFKFVECSQENADFFVTVNWATDLVIIIDDTNRKKDDVIINIAISPRSGKWSLGVEKVILKVRTFNTLGYTAVWKAFDHELIKNSIKADIVQLNGYYQHLPEMICSFSAKENTVYNRILENVITNSNIPEITSTEQMANRWKVTTDQVAEYAEWLKSLGYEIRNHHTNPQIDNGYWLIPYVFPTLTPLSVQLHKKLK